MLRDRLQLALDQLHLDRWADFEELASTFAADQYPNLQTLASSSGDRGRDGVLWQPLDDPTVILQYSVTSDWKAKVRATARQVGKEFPGCEVLLYFSPLVIGPAADAITEEIPDLLT